ncbi:hypothetical protein QF032_003690 [Streptomyces achromogenes]|uniref:hypothetical protein n=1 Tax=Streptomyces achromogenes TaxID=67255 RepID=UPI00278B4FFF|nr:hypothetical protein [Streptomyces achromogenes]MDQ0831846.1 hypothetical protein [Streptomyces achromogenes]
MSESPQTTEAATPEATAAETPEATAAGTAVVGAPVAPRARRAGRIVAVAGSVLLACALVGGVGYTVVTVQNADRETGSPTWEFPRVPAVADDKAGGNGKKEGAAGSGLSALLLPYGTDGYQPGPDLAEFGPDAEFSGAQATALRKESLKDLPNASRRKLEKLIDKERIKGVAMRSYAVDWSDYNIKDTITLDVTLSRQENPTAVRRSATAFNGFVTAMDVFRKGPKIEGHPDARCFLSPKGESTDLGTALCTAAVGDVLVSVTSAAPEPIDGTFVAKFFAKQLDRIDDPGQAV